MEETLHKKKRSLIKLWLHELDLVINTNLMERYEEWLTIMDSTHHNYRRPIPPGLADFGDYLCKKSDIEKWIATEDLVSIDKDRYDEDQKLVAVRPDYKYYAKSSDWADYDCSISYYFRHKKTVNSIILRSLNVLATDPADRYAGHKNPYDHIRIEFTPEHQTAGMVADALLFQNTERLKHKANVYDRIIVSIAIKVLQLEAKPIIDELLLDTTPKSLTVERREELKSAVEKVLKEMEKRQCEARGIEWTDQIPERYRRN